MYTRSGLELIRRRLSSQIRWKSEPSTSRESSNHRRCFVDTVLNGHSKAIVELEKEIVKMDDKRRKLLGGENRLLTHLLPRLENQILSLRCGFVPVGSVVTGLASSHSDLDVVLFPTNETMRNEFLKTFDNNHGLKYELMSILRSSLVHSIHSLGMADFVVDDCLIFPHLRIPLLICKFTNGDSLDISLPGLDYQAIRNTHLMRHYAACDARLGRLLLWLRHWSSSLGIRESKTGLLSSYHLLLLAVHFLQSEQSLGATPVLPVLYQTNREEVDKDIHIQTIANSIMQPSLFHRIDWTSNNLMSTAELVVRFIDYYSDLNVLTKSIHIDRGLARKRSNAMREQAQIYDPYSNQTACKSVPAMKAFNEAVNFTQRRMKTGFMLNPFSPSDSSFSNFIESTKFTDWSSSAAKKRVKMNRIGLGMRDEM
ncbi:hypothetical protein PFISCL1PPCAC_1750 [Pristionchus fissidentatus]|uniref:Poly(A) RNA polymerase mitochondrial-like central palm domain-containing protein n=1 Tax=Pristionchus fissidentatus TaxID=1538716 RepID=A0AAV5UWB2_9BILA|nr:hypothetical protein PFISCL1PPCAC_1750 [Pristionchus fissidentatus]